MKIIYTSKREEIWVDDKNYEIFNQHLWMVNNNGYAVRRGKKSDGDRVGYSILMHREIMNPKEDEIVDHRNRKEKLNNQESNLRTCSRQQNQFNSKRESEENTSQHKGVYKKDNGTYVMQIQDGLTKVVLNFDEEVFAAAAYDHYAKEMFGDFAILNGIDIPVEVWSEHITRKWNHKNTTSRYKGVCLKKDKWLSQIYYKGKMVFIGYFNTEKEAALAYNLKSLELSGEDAFVNNIEGSNEVYLFTILQRPIAKSNMYKARAIGKRAIIYTSKELVQYELLIGSIAQSIIPKTLSGLHSIYIRFYSKETKLYDVDNGFKAILDSLDNSKVIKNGKKEILVCETGIENDKMFQLVIGERVFVDDKDEERIEVLIAPYEGLFRFTDLIISTYGEGEWVDSG